MAMMIFIVMDEMLLLRPPSKVTNNRHRKKEKHCTRFVKTALYFNVKREAGGVKRH